MPHMCLYRSGGFLFQKSLRVRREVLALPNRITSKISAPLFGARARLALSHWVAAMEFPVALLAILCLRSAHHCTFATRSLRRLLFTRLCSAIARPTECFPPVTTSFFPVRSRVISQASTSGINSSSRWKKLLIRSYRLPVLWTSITNRVTPSSNR